MKKAVTAPDLDDALASWRRWMASERRAAKKTLEAYERDLQEFLSFMTEHKGQRLRLKDLQALTAQDFRAWLAARTLTGQRRSSTARNLSVVRSFFRWLAKRQGLENPAILTLRSPKVPKSLPRALDPDQARETVERVADLNGEGPGWVAMRDTTILLLLYGCGLRLGEALSLTPEDLPGSGKDILMIRGKGGKERLVPLDAGRGAFSRQARQGAGPKGDSAAYGGFTRPARVAARCQPPCPAPFFRHAYLGRRRGPARDPGTPRACCALDDATLHGRRFRATAVHLRQIPPAGLTKAAGRQSEAI
jgi:integrase